MPGLEDYASPILRAAVFRRLNPGAQISYTVIPISEAFPTGYSEYEGKATEAVRCEIVLADGTYIVANKEIDKTERNRPVDQTPENLAKNETKALGRALRDAGVPQRLSELKLVMSWISSMDGRPTQVQDISSLRRAPISEVSEITEAFPGTTVEDEDAADAGSEDPTPEQLLAKRFAFLGGPAKAAVVKYARETLNVSNVMRAGEHAEALIAYIDKSVAEGLSGLSDAVAHDERNDERRAQAAATLEPEEEF